MATSAIDRKTRTVKAFTVRSFRSLFDPKSPRKPKASDPKINKNIEIMAIFVNGTKILLKV